MHPSVVIAGGGLAGLSCALALGSAGFDVTVCERSDRLGGKAGARAPSKGPGDFPLPVEHGPHFFAAWYLNTLALMDRLGVRDRLVNFDGYEYLFPSEDHERPGRSAHVLVAGGSLVATLGGYLTNLRNGPMDWTLMAQNASLMLDLLTMQMGPRLDELSVGSLIHSRWYGDERLAAEFHHQILRAASVPAATASAQTIQRLLGLWLNYPRPFLSVLDTDLMSGLVDPLGDAVGRVAQVRLRTPVSGLIVGKAGIEGVQLDDGGEVRSDLTIAAVPVEVMRRWISDEVYALDPRLSAVNRLQTAPMASFQMAFDRPIMGLPSGVVYLLGSSPMLNLIDLGQVWRDLPPGCESALSIIVSDYHEIGGLSDRRQVELVLGELRRYLPDATPSGLCGLAVRPNCDDPLFLNTVGSWSSRPHPAEPYGSLRARARLHVIGDYTQTPVDVACMEGAVLSGLLAARAIARRFGVTSGMEILELDMPGSRRLAGCRLAKQVLVPVTYAGRLATRRRARGDTRRSRRFMARREG